jgi:Fe-S oxidoreductase
MWMEEQADQRVNVERTREALDTGAEWIATSCPFCMTMMEDGVKAKDADEKVRILDVAEVVWNALDTTAKRS